MKNLPRVLLGFSSFLLTISLSASEQTDTANIAPKNWYKIGFSVSFDNTKKRYDHLNIYQSADDIAGSSRDNVFQPTPAALQSKLFSPRILNPFRSIFTDIYDQANEQAINNCKFVSVQFELDDNSHTTEWIIASPAEKCLYGDKAAHTSGNSATHLWVLQQYNENNYQVLLESEGLLHVINEKYQGYKTIEAQIFNKHIYRRDPLACGYGLIEWRYRSGEYSPHQLHPKINGCDSLFPEEARELPHFREARMLHSVKKRLNRWLSEFEKGVLGSL